MASIREKKKHKTREAILRSSEKLFTQQGFANTTVKQIAEDALVAVGTVYNYFGGKGELLVALMVSHTERVLERGKAVIKRAEGDVEQALVELLSLYAEAFFCHGEAVLREVISPAISHPGSIGARALELDGRLTGQVAELLCKFQREGVLEAGLPVDKAAWVVYAVFSSAVIVWVQIGFPEPGQLRAELAEQVGLLVRGWRSTEGGWLGGAGL